MYIYLIPIDKPLKGGRRIAVVTGAVQVDPVAQAIVLTLVAGDHRKSFRQAYHCQLTAHLYELEGRRVHRNLAGVKAGRLQGDTQECQLMGACRYYLKGNTNLGVVESLSEAD